MIQHIGDLLLRDVQYTQVGKPGIREGGGGEKGERGGGGRGRGRGERGEGEGYTCTK